MTLKKKSPSLRVKFYLVLGSIFFSLSVGELVVRDYHLGFTNLILSQGGNLIEHHFRGVYSHHPELGWVPAENTVQEKWGTPVHTVSDGIRVNGPDILENKRPLIMAVGDSFTFGDQVADHLTWPAFLEKFSGFPVLNAGVSSYGFDQSVLRAGKLVPKYKPDILIVSLVYDDLDRCRQSVRHGVPKPYFTIESNRLVLQNVPVPFQESKKMDAIRSVLGYSHLAHKLMDRLSAQYWWQDTMLDYRYVDTDLILLVTLLFGQLARLAELNQLQLVVLFQDDVNVSETRALVAGRFIRFLQEHYPNFKICNVIPGLLKIKRHSPDMFSQLYVDEPSGGKHMSVQGNALVAAALKSVLDEMIREGQF